LYDYHSILLWKAFTLDVKKDKQGLSPSTRETRNSPGRGTIQSQSPNFLAKHPGDDQARPIQGEKENIPFPRLCSAVFGSNGFLLKIVNVPKEGLPFTKNKLVWLTKNKLIWLTINWYDHWKDIIFLIGYFLSSLFQINIYNYL
jgi:hypothetical protein